MEIMAQAEVIAVFQSLAHMFLNRVESSSDRVACRFKEGRSPYRDLSWKDLGKLAREMSLGLVALGLEPGRSTAIMANTSYLWAASDQAILLAGGVTVPVYPTCSSADLQHILNDSDIEFIFVQTESLLNKILAVRSALPHLRKIILLSAPAKGRSLSELSTEPDLVLGLEELQEYGRKLETQEPETLNNRIAAVGAEHTATIIYTSGTTGTPKGVVLTHGNILCLLADLPSVMPILPSDTSLALLPMSHVFERICGEFYWIFVGSVCAYAEGIEHVARNMAEIQPEIMMVVPRLLDKIFVKVRGGINGASPNRRRLIEWALAVGKQTMLLKSYGKEPSVFARFQHRIAEKLVFSKLREKINPKTRFIVSGGAPANPEVILFFNSIGMNVVEGYGLTETAAPTNVNRIGQVRPGTVGTLLPSVEIKIADDGEILFRGPSIFKGYYKLDEQSREVFSDGWFHTGDIGELDQDGYLKITDRKKDIIVNSAGKNIAPQKIEGMLKNIPGVNQAVVFGDKKKTLVALLTLDEQSICEVARDHNWEFSGYDELLGKPELMSYFKNEINKVSPSLADYERVRNFSILPQELSVEAGELTATLKIKRNVLKEKYKDLIESLYREDNVLVV